MSATVPVNNVNNTTQLERGTAHPVGSTGHHLFNKDHHATNTTHHSSNQFAKDNMNANTGAGDTYGHSDNIVKTGQYATGLENNTTAVPLRNTAHLPSSVSDSHNQATGHGTGLTGTHNAGMIGTGLTGAGLNNGAAHLPAGSAVPIVGGHQNVITGVNNVPSAGPQLQNTAPNAANRDGLVVNDGIGGPLGGAVILGGQCECLANGGACSHGAGRCVCRGCTAQATTVNPGINIGVSTAQYTAPVGTSGLGGGVADPNTGIAGLVHPNSATLAAGNSHHTTGTHTGTTHTSTGHHGLFGSHHNNATTTAATTGTGLTGATGMHHAARNVDGDGHHTLANQGVVGNQDVIGSSSTAGTNTYGAR